MLLIILWVKWFIEYRKSVTTKLPLQISNTVYPSFIAIIVFISVTVEANMMELNPQKSTVDHQNMLKLFFFFFLY